MDNELIRKAIFAVIAVVVVGLGVYATAFQPEEGAPASPVTETPAAAPTSAPVATVAPSVEPVEVDASDAEEAVEVAPPLSSKELVAAATQARAFLLAYGSFDYRVSEDRQGSIVAGYVDPDAQFDMSTIVPRGAIREAMVAGETITTARVRFDETTLVTGESAAFLVTVSTTTKGTDAGESTDALTITMTRSGSSWKVIALDQGDEFGDA